MTPSLHVLSVSATRLYDEALLLARGNLVWFLLTLPLHGLLLLLALPLFEVRLGLSGVPSLLPLAVVAFLGLVLPTPAAAGLYHLALPIVRGETTSFHTYWTGLARHWRQGTLMFSIGVAGLALATYQALFYLRMGGGWQLLSAAWLYAGLFWLILQPHLYPLLLAFPADSTVRRYQRAALLVLGNPFQSLALLGCAFVLAVVSGVVPPLYPLLAMAFLSLAGSRALLELQTRHAQAGHHAAG